jgi:hypothetical protein
MVTIKRLKNQVSSLGFSVPTGPGSAINSAPLADGPAEADVVFEAKQRPLG